MTYQNSLVLTPLAEGHDVADNQLCDGHQAPAADTGEGAEGDQLRGRLRKRRGERADEEDGQPDQQHELARPDVGEAAVQELEARRRDEVAAGEPRGLAVRAQGVGHDMQTGRQRGLVHQSKQVDAGTGQEDLVMAG